MIEEPDVYRARPPAKAPDIVRRVILAAYQQHGAYQSAVTKLHREEPLHAVVPALG